MVSFSQTLLLLFYAVGMAAGQVLFKLAAGRYGSNGWVAGFRSVFSAPEIYLGIALYGFLTVFWVWLLTFIPLSRAYPVIVVPLILTSALGVILFAEPMSAKLVVGMLLIFGGLFCIWS